MNLSKYVILSVGGGVGADKNGEGGVSFGGGGSVIYSDSQDQLQSHPSRSAALVLRGEIVPSE